MSASSAADQDSETTLKSRGQTDEVTEAINGSVSHVRVFMIYGPQPSPMYGTIKIPLRPATDIKISPYNIKAQWIVELLESVHQFLAQQ